MTLKRIILFSVFLFVVTAAAGVRLVQIHNIRISGKLPLKASRLRSIMGIKTGAALTLTDLETGQEKLLRFLNRKGYLWARIDSTRLIALGDSTQFDWELSVHSGPLFTVDAIRIISDSLPTEAYLKKMRLHIGSAFDQDLLKADLQTVMRFAAEQGYPFVEISPHPEIVRATHRITLTIRIKEGNKIFIKGIVLQGNRYTKPQVVLRALYFSPAMPFRQSWFAKILPRLQKLLIFKSVGTPQMIRTAADSVVIVIPVEEGNAASFDGVLGYVPQPGKNRLTKQKGYFTGLLNFSFQNLFGTGRKLKIFWEKSDRLSENFHFGYQEPWVFQQPLDLGINFAREVKDTLYIAYNLNLNGNLHINDRLGLFADFSRRSVIPDSFARSALHLLKNRVYNLESGMRYDTRDYPLNPSQGVFYQGSYRFGLKKNDLLPGQTAGDSLSGTLSLNTVSLTFEFYHPIFKNQVLAFALHGKRIRGSHLQLSDYFWFGGSNSVRGYREKQFSGYLVSWANLEYRFLTGRNTRIFLFSDFGYYENNITGQKAKKFLQGNGLGLRFETPMGIMKLDFGFARGEGFNQGKIHFGLSSRF